jgi:hypothetical protein
VIIAVSFVKGKASRVTHVKLIVESINPYINLLIGHSIHLSERMPNLLEEFEMFSVESHVSSESRAEDPNA